MSDEVFRLAPDSELARHSAAELFGEIEASLIAFLPASAEVLHVGSTALAGCLTKGDLDVVVRVARHDFSLAEAELQLRYPRNLTSARTHDFSAFCAAPEVGIQLAAIGGAFDFFHLFSDALRDAPELVEAYNRLKRRYNGLPMEDYRKAKSAFVKAVLANREAREKLHHPDDVSVRVCCSSPGDCDGLSM